MVIEGRIATGYVKEGLLLHAMYSHHWPSFGRSISTNARASTTAKLTIAAQDSQEDHSGIIIVQSILHQKRTPT